MVCLSARWLRRQHRPALSLPGAGDAWMGNQVAEKDSLLWPALPLRI